MKRLLTVLISGILIISCTTTEKTTSEISNKEKAIKITKSFASGEITPVSDFISKEYIEHSVTIPYKDQGDKTLLPESDSMVNNIRTFEDGEYIVLHSRYNIPGKNEEIAFDIFRFENGKAVEHWDNRTSAQPINPSGNSQTDGSIEFKDIEKTEENKILVRQFVSDILMGEHPEKLNQYFTGNNYIQHNPAIPDGVDGLNGAFENLSLSSMSMNYNRIQFVLGYGNFVLVVTEGSFGPTNNPAPTSYYDLFRVEESKIAEHWDIMTFIGEEK